jgi:hypothetical protein
MCFGMDWLFHFLIMLIVVCVVIGVLVALVPYILSLAGLGIGEPVMRIVRLIAIGIALIFLVYLVWNLWDCFAVGGMPLRR